MRQKQAHQQKSLLSRLARLIIVLQHIRLVFANFLEKRNESWDERCKLLLKYL